MALRQHPCSQAGENKRIRGKQNARKKKEADDTSGDAGTEAMGDREQGCVDSEQPNGEDREYRDVNAAESALIGSVAAARAREVVKKILKGSLQPAQRRMLREIDRVHSDKQVLTSAQVLQMLVKGSDEEIDD